MDVGKILMKGQMFIIAAIIMITGLIALKTLFSAYQATEEKRYHEAAIYNDNLRNIEHEYENIISIGSRQPSVNSSTVHYLNDFSSFLQSEDSGLKIFYVYIFRNETGNNIQFSAGNYMHTTINVNASTETEGYNLQIADRTNSTVYFHSNDAINVTIIYYSDDYGKEILSISKKNFTAGFFDIILEKQDFTGRMKEFRSATW